MKKQIGKYFLSVIDISYETYEGVYKGNESAIFENGVLLKITGEDLTELFESCKTEQDVEKILEEK